MAVCGAWLVNSNSSSGSREALASSLGTSRLQGRGCLGTIGEAVSHATFAVTCQLRSPSLSLVFLSRSLLLPQSRVSHQEFTMLSCPCLYVLFSFCSERPECLSQNILFAERHESAKSNELERESSLQVYCDMHSGSPSAATPPPRELS